MVRTLPYVRFCNRDANLDAAFVEILAKRTTRIFMERNQMEFYQVFN